MSARLRRAVGGFFLLLMGLSAGYANNSAGIRDRFPPPAARAVTDQQEPGAAPVGLRSLPWWEPVATVRGSGDGTSRTFRIAPEAVQWRVTATCTSGRIAVRAVRRGVAVGRRDLVPSHTCATPAEGFSVARGELALQVRADGPWSAVVEQQVDRPKAEPALPEMTAPGAAVASTGSFYDVDRTGRGTVTVHRLADGRHALRLSDFFVSINADLEIWLSSAAAPRSTDEAARAEHVSVAELEATAGSMNFVLPAGVDPAGFRSVVIWCEITRNAYAAAALRP